jgi:hypothetical protein
MERFGLDIASYTAPTFPVYLIPGITLRVPNPGLLSRHDLHHIVTGYPPTVLGEAQVSAFELGAGCRSLAVRFYCCGSIALGFWRSPSRIVRAWHEGRGGRTLYDTDLSYEAILAMTVAELRQYAGVLETGCPGAQEKE